MISRRRLKSFSFARHGLVKAWHEEPNFRIQASAAILAVLLGVVLKIGHARLAIIVLACAAVLCLELVNTMVEVVSDLLKPRLNHYVQQIKDISAAAVLVASLAAGVIGLLLLGPPLWRLIWQ